MATHEPQSRMSLGPQDTGRSLTAEEFADADYLEPWKYERANGRLVVMAPDGMDHIVTTSPWLRQLFRYWDEHPETIRWIVPNAWVRVDDDTDRIGDIGVYLVHDPPTRKIPDQVPELMFEIVSPGKRSRNRDDVQKRADYHKLGVREYVIVDRIKKQVTVLTHAPEGYQERVLSRAETYMSPLLPGLEIALAEVFEP